MTNTFVKAMKQPTVTTWNGAESLATTMNALVDLFFKTVRGLDRPRLEGYLKNAWAENPLATLRLIFYVRDCRGGKGEKQLFYWAMEWLRREHSEVFVKNVKYIPEYGYWKDIVNLINLMGVDAPNARQLADFHVQQIRKDFNTSAGKGITLAAKYAPSEGGSNSGLARRYASLLSRKGFDKTSNSSALKSYRKGLSTLRKRLDIVERYACAKDWSGIHYASVPSRAMMNYRKAFFKNDKDRFESFVERVKKGTDKVKGGQLFPHELTKKLMTSGYDDVLEIQLQALIDGIRELGNLSNMIPVIDTSWSMTWETQPIYPAYALGLVASELIAEPFRGKMISFASDPVFHDIKGNSFTEKLNSIQQCSVGGSTNFQAVFELILDRAKTYNVPQADMPGTILVLSDMQFNACARGTNLDNVRSKYRKAGYDMPKIVFWNLNGSSIDFPATAEDKNIGLVSGFAASMLQLFMETGEFTPASLVRQVVDSPRYAQITL